MSESPSLRLEKDIKAPVKEVYRAFTKQSTITEWLCNTASIDITMLTRLYLWWDNGYYTCGEFLKVVPDKEIIFSWLGRDDPGKTRVRVTFKPVDSGTHLILEHRGMKEDEKWKSTVEQIRHGWEIALNNLVSILETGQDLRIINRPMLGINMDDFSPDIAAAMGIPVFQGVRLEGVVEGMGAEKSGLRKDDVLVEIGGKPVLGYHSLASVLLGKKAGQKVDIVYYRGPEKHTATLVLSPRPIPEVPTTPSELAQAVAELYEQGDQLLAAALQGISEEEASFKVSLVDWSAKEVLAHLIHTERDWQFQIQKWMLSDDSGFAPNLDSRIKATVKVFPTIPDLTLELKRAETETVELLRNLPGEFVAQKDTFWLLAYNQVQFKSHTSEHAEQINAAVAAARKK